MLFKARVASRNLLLLAVGSCFASGCGGSDAATYKVSGKVTFPDGTTLKDGGEVIFISTNLEKTVRASGAFGPDGNYELTTYSEGDGAPEGNYNVAVVPLMPDEDDDSISGREFLKLSQPIDNRFVDPSSSGLKFSISSDSSPHVFNIEVTKPKKRSRRR